MGILTRKEQFDYFEGFLRSSRSATEAARYLFGAFANFEPQKVPRHVEEMHRIENDADGSKHELMRALAKEFVTPLEREDISALSQELDNVVDAIEEVMRRVYMFGVTKLRPESSEFAQLIVRSCESCERVMMEFKNFRKSKDIHRYIIEVNTLESDGDRMYTDAVRRLFMESRDADTRLVWLSIFESLEGCLDACEHAADIIEGVIMKNT